MIKCEHTYIKPLKTACLCLILLVLMPSCRQQAEYISPRGFPNTKKGNFDAFWNGMDQNYVFFTHQNIDWQGVYERYLPQINETLTDRQLFNLFTRILDELIDGHRTLTAPFARYSVFNQAYITRYPEVNTDSIVINNYASYDSFGRLEGVFYTGSSVGTEALLTRIKNERIAYLRIYAFDDFLTNNSQADNLNTNLTIVQNTNYKGLIIDVRSNGGGKARAFYNILSRLVTGDYHWGYSQFRIERDRYKTTPYIPENVKKAPNSVTFTKPIIVLTNRYSFSAAEVLALAMHNLPNVTLMGDTTGGAQGPISDEKEYTGNFLLPNNWRVQLAQKATFDNKKQLFEGVGVPPNIVIKASPQLAAQGIDNVLEAAIERLKNL